MFSPDLRFLWKSPLLLSEKDTDKSQEHLSGPDWGWIHLGRYNGMDATNWISSTVFFPTTVHGRRWSFNYQATAGLAHLKWEIIVRVLRIDTPNGNKSHVCRMSPVSVWVQFISRLKLAVIQSGNVFCCLRDDSVFKAARTWRNFVLVLACNCCFNGKLLPKEGQWLHHFLFLKWIHFLVLPFLKQQRKNTTAQNNPTNSNSFSILFRVSAQAHVRLKCCHSESEAAQVRHVCHSFTSSGREARMMGFDRVFLSWPVVRRWIDSSSKGAQSCQKARVMPDLSACEKIEKVDCRDVKKMLFSPFCAFVITFPNLVKQNGTFTNGGRNSLDGILLELLTTHVGFEWPSKTSNNFPPVVSMVFWK